MDTELDVKQLKKPENLSKESTEQLDSKCIGVEAKKAVELPQPSTVTATNTGSALGPITPDSNREIGDTFTDFTSPLTLVSSSPKSISLDSHISNDPYPSNDDDTPCTPKESIFDSFAPGPNKLMLAPHHRKYLAQSQINVARRLDFGASLKFVENENRGSDDDTRLDEEMFVETVYDTLLEAIVSKQTEGVIPQISHLDTGSDGYKTPTSAPRLSGIAETCPGAPMKSTRKLINVDPGLCRKLEF
ncbi:unnamed protein product [Ilex paraguariensis]|uniref:Uncharacterized protein n=1 Tax=Ilex paraguariensis TaxID=185542 RepID=A0ABC8S9G4_9AQUA